MADFKEALNANDLIDIMRGFDKAIEDQGRIEQMMIDLRHKEVLPAIEKAEETVEIVNDLVKNATVTSKQLKNIDDNIEQAQTDAKSALISSKGLLANINTINDKFNGYDKTLTDAQGNISALNSRADGFENLLGQKVDESTLTDVRKLITDNSIAIAGNKNALKLKADQTMVDRVNQSVSDLTAQQTLQANAIETKASKSDVTQAVNGLATQEFVESKVKVASDYVDLNVTKLNAAVDGLRGGLAANLMTQPTYDWVHKSGKDNFLTIIERNIKVKPNTTYTLSMDLNVPAKYAYTCFKVDEYDASGKRIGTPNGNFDGWQNPITEGIYSKTFVTSDKVATLEIGLFSGNAVVDDATNYSYRHVMLEEGAEAHAYTTNKIASLADLTLAFDGIKQTVQNGVSKSEFDMLSNAVQSKVSQADLQTAISQTEKNINLATVQKGKVIAQFNQEAGQTLIQNDKFIISANSTIIDGTAFIKSANIIDINADKITGGKINTNNLTIGNDIASIISDNNEFRIKKNSDDLSELILSKGLMAIRQPGTNSRYSGMWLDQNGKHLRIATQNKDSDYDYNVLEMNNEAINLGIGNFNTSKNHTNIWIQKGYVRIADDFNWDNNIAVKLELRGWAWVNGYVEAQGHSTHSTLSSKTNIVPMDIKKSYDLVKNTDLTWFTYKNEAKTGDMTRHAGPIIDDVNSVSQYSTPKEFISPTRTARDDGNMLGVLMGAVQYLSKKVENLENGK